jgi:hypothetical protein
MVFWQVRPVVQASVVGVGWTGEGHAQEVAQYAAATGSIAATGGALYFECDTAELCGCVNIPCSQRNAITSGLQVSALGYGGGIVAFAAASQATPNLTALFVSKGAINSVEAQYASAAKFPTSIATDGQIIYWVEQDGTVLQNRADGDGGAPTTYGMGIVGGLVAVDADAVYFTTPEGLKRGSLSNSDGPLLSPGSVSTFALSKSYVYFADPRGISRIHK